MNLDKQILVSTGTTSGIGHAAVQKLSDSFYIIQGSRSLYYADTPAPADSTPSGIHLPLELASLSSVRNFAEHVIELLNQTRKRIDVVLLCAGMWKESLVRISEGQYTGWCQEAVVNHYAQHLLLVLLEPHLSSDARVVFIGSKLHRSIKSISSIRMTLNVDLSSLPTSTGQERYAASKFLQTVSAAWWNQRFQGSSRIVILLSPGLIPTTGLSRESGFIKSWVMRNVMYWAPFCSTISQGADGIFNTIVHDRISETRRRTDDLIYINNSGEDLEVSPLIYSNKNELFKEFIPDYFPNTQDLSLR